MTTAARAATFTPYRGCRLLSRAPASYADGAEPRLLEIISEATDRSSLSEELAQQATTWAEEYHLSRSRSNMLRGFEFDPSSRVLEVGAGCGSITRYLGETFETVDALEPETDRAIVARARTADLENVEIFLGAVHDIPTFPSYDLVVLVGVLEWSGGGTADNEVYRAFLSSLRALCDRGGQLLCAIENQFGVRYLCGSPEDHTCVPFRGIEGYHDSSPARTFSRSQLESHFAAAGFASTSVHHAFPDYKMTKVLLPDAAFGVDHLSDFVKDAPPFPSPDRGVIAARVAHEASVWGGLVDAGLGPHTANSFVVVAAADSSAQSAPTASILSVDGRRSQFATLTSVQLSSPFGVSKRRLSGVAGPVTHGPVTHAPRDGSIVAGPSFLRAFPVRDGLLQSGIEAWANLVKESVDEHPPGLDFDLLPRNLIFSSGALRAIDREWSIDGWTADDVIGRGLLGLLPELFDNRGEVLPACRPSAHAFLTALGERQGLGSGFLDKAIRREVELVEVVGGPAEVHNPRWGGLDQWQTVMGEMLLRQPPRAEPSALAAVRARSAGLLRRAKRLLGRSS